MILHFLHFLTEMSIKIKRVNTHIRQLEELSDLEIHLEIHCNLVDATKIEISFPILSFQTDLGKQCRPRFVSIRVEVLRNSLIFVCTVCNSVLIYLKKKNPW